MRKLIFIALLAFSFVAQAQEVKWVKVLRTTAPSIKASAFDNPTLLNSRTDTTEWTTLGSQAALDTILEAVFSANVDSTKLTIKVQFGINGNVMFTTQVDSAAKGQWPAAATDAANRSAVGQKLWYRRPAGADQMRIIITTASTGNQGAYLATPNKTYRVGIINRKTLK
jgi:hypothetical protein